MRKIILSILHRTRCIWPDKLYIKLRYWLVLNERLNLEHPIKFSEKIQWLKFYNRNPEYKIMVDKYRVKDFVANIIGKEYIIPTIGVWDNPDDIDFSILPSKFVLKCNHNSGGLCICKNKDILDVNEVRKKLKKSFQEDYYWQYREWPYKNMQKKIIAEVYMEDNRTSEIIDYKFFCFHGVPRLCQVISNRLSDEKIDFYDMNWKRIIGLTGLNLFIKNSECGIARPTTFNTMKQIASQLSNNIPFARIDLYEINNKCYFGEITFFPAGGMGRFQPIEWNTTIGSWIDLNNCKK